MSPEEINKQLHDLPAKVSAEMDQEVSELFMETIGCGPQFALLIRRSDWAEMSDAAPEVRALILRLAKLGHTYMCYVKMGGSETDSGASQ